MEEEYFTAESKVKDILREYPELVDFMVREGFVHLADPEFRKVVPITLSQALSHHGKDPESFLNAMREVVKAHRG